MADQILSAVAPNIFERCFGAAGEHLGYIWNYKSNVAKLESQVNKLDGERADKSHAVTLAENNAHRIRDGITSWQGKADKISEEATQVLKDHQDKGKKRCFMGLCPNLVLHYKFSKRACKEQTEVEEAITEAQRITQVSDPPVGQEKTILSTDGCFTFDSRMSLLEDIIKALRDETNNLVGVYGLGGMGKTTLAKQVASQATKETMFEEVVMASVTQNADMKEIQGQIASMLGLKLSESTIAERATRIHERLKGKKVLVVLDDLWKELDLKQVGIPFGTEHMGCKILLTSRFQPVLVSMGTKKEFSLVALNEEEAWKLFEEKATDVVKNPAFLRVGKKVANRCAGVPVLIVTVAASLSRRPQLSAWNDALEQLKKMNNKEMHDIVNSAIESISYKHLEKTHKRLFVLCGVIGGEASVEEVFQYGTGWGLFDDEVVTLQGARERLHSVILDLKDHCLLLDDHRRNSIKMHDVVRDIAISIGKKDLSTFSIGDNDAELDIWRMDDVLKRCTSLVLRACPNLSCLPQQLECPKLEVCILRPFWRSYSLTIPNTLFEKTGKLKVLDMSLLGFSVLPSSLSFLKNLQALRVHNCGNLKDISGVGELKKLQTLSFVGSNIEELPSGIGELSELRLLDVRHCSKLKVIPAGLIKGLSRLEELYVSSKFVRWEADECISGCVGNNASLVELKHLPNLCTLEVAVEDAKLLPQDLNFEKFERYEITVGVMWDYWSCWECFIDPEITRKFCLQVGCTSINHWRHKLLKTTECLKLGEVKGIKNVSPELDENGFPDLKHLYIKKDYEMQYIVNVEDGQHQVAFPSLESLRLSHLLKLQKICNGRLMKKTFNNLAVMEVENCNELKSLFSFSMNIEPRCLEEIGVSEGIVGEKKEDGGVREKIEFCQLHKLSLKCLPKLKNFISYGKILPASHNSSTSDDESEEELQSCVPFFEKVSFPKLEELTLSKISNLTNIWSQEMPCANLTKLEIVECERLKYLLTPSVAMALVGLQSLTVQKCVRMEHVVTKEEGETNIEMISFPQLTHLHLKSLPHLATFYAGSKDSNDSAVQPLFNEKLQFPMLKQLEIDHLESINILWQNGQLYQADSFCKLEQVRIGSCASLVKMFSSTTHVDSKKKDPQESLMFQNLRVVSFHQCKSLKHVFPVSVSHCLNKLEELTIRDCQVLETIIGDESYEESTQQVAFLFPKLARLQLERLPKVECFYPREYTTKYPALKILHVADCGYISAMDFLSFPEIQGDDQMISYMKELNIRSMDMMKIYDHFPPHLFQRLENLTITDFRGESAVFPSKFLSTLHNQLKKFGVVNCSFPEVFPYEEVTRQADDDVFLPQLISLRLEKLPELKSICKQDQYSPFISNILDKIRYLYVSECPRLTSLVSPSVSFRLLEWLTISNCSGLINVMQLSTARSLKQLRMLSIVKCEMMEEIIGGEVGDYESSLEDEIIFSQLRYIGLNKLPSLTSFCSSRHYTFNFPRLRSVTVTECPNMKTFSGGITTTPLLEKVNLGWVDRTTTCWKNDLNATIERIDTEMVISGLKDVSIRSMDMMNIRRLYDHVPPRLFQRLENLTITEFQGESAVFPSKFLSTVHSQLKKFRVVNCSFQEVFPYEGEVTSHADDDVFLPQLTSLGLEKLPELKSICKQDQYSPFVSNILDKIRDLYVSECPRLTSLVSPSVSFTLLEWLTISNCSGLINVIQPSTARSLKQLRTLSIIECKMIEEIVGGEVGDYDSSLDDDDDEIIFSQLWRLELNKLPRLTSFCSSRDYTFDFPLLRSVTVIECPNMKTFSGGITTTPLLEKVYLEQILEDPTMCWEHDLNTTVELIYTKREAKRRATTLPRSNHFEAQAQIHETRKEVVARRSQDSDKLVKVVDDIPDKGKGKQLQDSEETPLAEQVVAISQLVPASSSRSRSIPPTESPSNQVSQMQVQRLIPITSSNYHFKTQAQIHVKPAEKANDEPIREGQNCDQVTVKGGQEADIHEKRTAKESEEIVELRNESETWNQSETSPFLVTKLCENEIEPRKGTEISEEEVICGNYTTQEETIAGSMSCQDVVAQLIPPNPITNPRDEISLSLATRVEVERGSATAARTSSCKKSEAEACDKGKGKEIEDPVKAGETLNHSEVPSSQRATDLHVNKHFIPLLSEFLQIIQNQPLKSMSPQRVQFMEDAYRHLSSMNFSIDWFRPYVDKAREYLAVVEHEREVSELELEIAKVEADLKAMKDKKKALKEKHEVIASRIDLDKALLDN